jgi:hypothetical protein
MFIIWQLFDNMSLNIEIAVQGGSSLFIELNIRIKSFNIFVQNNKKKVPLNMQLFKEEVVYL